MTITARRYDWHVTYLLLVDYCAIVGTFAVVMRLRFMPHIDIIDLSRLHVIPQVLFVFAYAIIVLGLFAVLGLYKRKVWLSPAWHAAALVKGVVLCDLGYILLRYLTQSRIFMEHRSVSIAWGLFLLVALLLHRLLVFAWLRRFLSVTDFKRRVVVVGANEIGRQFAEKCLSGENYPSLKVIGFLDNDVPVGTDVTTGIQCLGEIASLPDITDLYKIEGAVITDSSLSYQQLMDVTEVGVKLFGWVDIHSDKARCLQENLDADTYFDIPFVRMGSVRHGWLMDAYKRATDIVLALLGLVFLSPLLVVSAMMIKLTSAGPVFYVSNRIGYKGRSFRFYKFRSMRLGADRDMDREALAKAYIRDEASGLPGKIVNESYLTGWGRFMRKWGIDEMPQLVNVLKGDMSIVGPRPSPVGEYEVNDEWHKRRFDVRPGCTGLWKLYVARHRETPFNHTVLYDIYYIRNMTPVLDLYIMLGTVRIILNGQADV
jgi:lipopolysaccharide/colanic/teichoic acid biosynthesis glycosyltransferase